MEVVGAARSGRGDPYRKNPVITTLTALCATLAERYPSPRHPPSPNSLPFTVSSPPHWTAYPLPAITGKALDWQTLIFSLFFNKKSFFVNLIYPNTILLKDTSQ